MNIPWRFIWTGPEDYLSMYEEFFIFQFLMHVFRGSNGFFFVATHKVLYWGGVLLWWVLESNQAVWQMWSMMRQTSNCQLSVGLGIFFPCWCVSAWQVFLSDVVKDVETSKPLWEFIFPKCSIGIYFSSALVRLCYYLIWCCMSLKYVIPSYLLTLMIKSMMLSFFMTGLFKL
jgi:hypothetical protein